jgi:hypothetical protein
MRTATTLPHTNLNIESHNTLWNDVTKDGNFDKQRGQIKGVVWHTMQGYMAGTLTEFRNRRKVKSSNYGISQKGEIVLYVPENYTAYASGNLKYNREYISVETEDLGDPNMVRSDIFYEKCALLLVDCHQEYGFPLDRSANLFHRDIPHPTVVGKTVGQVTGKTCPGNLDVDRIIRMAKEKLNHATPSTPQPTSISGDEERALQFIRSSFSTLKTKDGTPFGNYEGLVREVIQIYPNYINLTSLGSDGLPKVMVDNTTFVNQVIRAKNFETIAKHFGYSNNDLNNPQLGDKLVEHIRSVVVSKPTTSLLNFDNAEQSTEQKAKPILLRDVREVWKVFVGKYLK